MTVLCSDLTRNTEIGMGNGLAGTRDIVCANGGSLNLWTGDVTYRLIQGDSKGFLQHSVVPGTGVYFALQTNHPVDPGDRIRLVAMPDDPNPVARS